MKLGIVTDVQVVHHRGRLVSPDMEMHQVGGFCPYFDEVLIFSPSPVIFNPNQPGLQTREPRNMRVVRVPGFWPRRIYGFMLTWPRVWRGLRRVLPEVDLVNIRIPQLCPLLGSMLCRRLGIPYFVSIHGDWMEQFRLKRSRSIRGRIMPIAGWFSERATQSVVRDAVVFSTSPDVLERIQPIVRSGHLIYSSLLNESDLADRPKQLGLSRSVRLLYVGVLEPHKGMQYAFDAMDLLAQRGVDFEFHMVGRGKLIEQGQRFAAQHGLEGRMFFHGFVPHGPELLEHFRRADIFIFPSLSEGSPKVVLEAMFNAVVIVSTAVGAIPSVITDGVHGRLVPVRDANAIADAVMDVIRDPERFTRLSAAALARAAEMTEARVMRRWIDDLEQAGLYAVTDAATRRQSERRL